MIDLRVRLRDGRTLYLEGGLPEDTSPQPVLFVPLPAPLYGVYFEFSPDAHEYVEIARQGRVEVRA